MGCYQLATEERKKEFHRRFLPKEFKLEELEGDGDVIAERLAFNAGMYPIYTSYFLQARLRVPFDPLLVHSLQRIHLHLSQVAPNTVRIILGLA